jgi:hypothetical protein
MFDNGRAADGAGAVTFVDTEIRPHREGSSTATCRCTTCALYKTFGMDQMAADSFDKRIEAEEGGEAIALKGGGGLHDAADHRAL